MHRAKLLIVTGVAEAGIGLSLLVLPSVPLALLLGVEDPSQESIFVARLFGAALVAIGAGCWLGRSDGLGPSQRGLLAGALVYDAAVAALLALAGLFSNLVGIALWHAVVLHSGLTVWRIICLRSEHTEVD
jgi:hypothetical protein